MIHWALFSTLAAGLFYGLYCLTLRRDRWLQLSRAYLIITLAFSLVYPLVRLPVSTLLEALPNYEAWLPEVVVGGDETGLTAEASWSAGVSPTIVLSVVYWAGVGACLIVLALQLVRITAMVMPARRRRSAIQLLDDDTPPYSFFNHIIIGTRGMSDQELQCVLAHESEHVRLRHSFDVLLVRLLCCIAWFNPFAWLMLRELRAVHEYQADAAVQSGKVYLALLYKQATGTGYGHITNKFNSINIKNRIVMMNKQKSRFGAWKMLAVLPVVALLMMVGCKPATEKAVDQEEIPFEYSGEDKSAPMDADTDQVFQVVEVDPEFPGGMEALIKYLSENIKYPEQAKKDKIQGRVYISFVVEKDGSVADAKVLRGIGGGCDEEALRVVQAMPKWKPGMQGGKPVRVQYNLPITFKLQQ